jgi:tellurite resistance protein TehA-like permease
MDTGILSIIMNLLPWQFNGLGILSTIMFVLNLVIFVVFAILSLLRVFMYPRYVKRQITSSVDELSYLGAPPTAYLTLVGQVALTCSTAWGYNWTVLAYVLWWIGLVWTVLVCSGHVIVLVKMNITEDRTLSPAVLLPLISVMTLGTTGGIVTNYSVGLSAEMGVPIIVTGFVAIGYALFLSFMYYAFLLHKLLAIGLPPPAGIPALVITVGPMGQFATAIQVLSRAASVRGMFGEYAQGTWLQSGSASSVNAAATLLALMAIGFGFLWATVAWYLVIEQFVKRQTVYGLKCWSLIFPMGVFTTSLLNLSNSLNSPAFRGFTTFLLIFMVILYLANWVGTCYRLYTGEALGISQQRQEEDEQAKEKKETLDRYVIRNSSGSGSGSTSNV